MKNTPAKNLKDIIDSDYFKIIGQGNRAYNMRRLKWEEKAVYEDDSIVGHVHLAKGSQFKISRNIHGLVFDYYVKYSDVMCFKKETATA